MLLRCTHSFDPDGRGLCPGVVWNAADLILTSTEENAIVPARHCNVGTFLVGVTLAISTIAIAAPQKPSTDSVGVPPKQEVLVDKQGPMRDQHRQAGKKREPPPLNDEMQRNADQMKKAADEVKAKQPGIDQQLGELQGAQKPLGKQGKQKSTIKPCNSAPDCNVPRVSPR